MDNEGLQKDLATEISLQSSLQWLCILCIDITILSKDDVTSTEPICLSSLSFISVDPFLSYLVSSTSLTSSYIVRAFMICKVCLYLL